MLVIKFTGFLTVFFFKLPHFTVFRLFKTTKTLFTLACENVKVLKNLHLNFTMTLFLCTGIEHAKRMFCLE